MRYWRWSGALEPHSVEKELKVMQCISKEDGNIVLLHNGESGNKLRRLINYMGLSAHHKTI